MITIIDYGAGNLGSLGNLFEKIGVPYRIATDTGEVRSAEAIVLPGVGAAKSGMDNLKRGGLDMAIKSAVGGGIPFLGICLGMQLLFDYSTEGGVDCLGLIKGNVKKFGSNVKIPQIGWNQVNINKANPVLDGISSGQYFYFVNSYYCQPNNKEITLATTDYGQTFASVITKDNIVATQFHPEKSGKAGLVFIKNFFNLYL